MSTCHSICLYKQLVMKIAWYVIHYGIVKSIVASGRCDLCYSYWLQQKPSLLPRSFISKLFDVTLIASVNYCFLFTVLRQYLYKTIIMYIIFLNYIYLSRNVCTCWCITFMWTFVRNKLIIIIIIINSHPCYL